MQDLVRYFNELRKQDMTPKQKFLFGLIIGVICGIAGSIAYLVEKL